MYKRRMKILFPTKKSKTLKHLIMNRGEFFELEKIVENPIDELDIEVPFNENKG